MAVLGYKQHDINIDIKSSKIKSFLYKKWFKMNQTLLILFSLYNKQTETFFSVSGLSWYEKGFDVPSFQIRYCPNLGPPVIQGSKICPFSLSISVCKKFKPPSIDNPLHGYPPFYILSEPLAFGKTFPTISSQWNTG